MTAKQLDAYLKGKGSPLAGYGKTFVQVGRKYRIDPRLLVAIAGAESEFGKHESGQANSWGWGPGIDFPSYEAAIETVAKGLRENYLNQGLKTIPQIGSKYAPSGAANDPTNLNSHWSRNVSKFFRELGGSSPAVSAGVPAPLPTAAPAAVSPSVDHAGVAFQNLGAIARGRFDPLESLGLLAQSVSLGGGAASSGPAATPAPSAPLPTRGGITYAGQKFTHPTSGLGGYPAVDLFAKPGTPFLAPESGRVVRHSGTGGTKGGTYGWSVYFQGDSGKKYYVQHLNKNRAPKGRVRKGQPLGTVSAWDGGASHAHVGVRG